MGVSTKWAGNPKDITHGFDFIHNRGYYSPKDGLVIYPDARRSINKKMLIYNRLAQAPLTGPARMNKFVNRGWGISNRQRRIIRYLAREASIKRD